MRRFAANRWLVSLTGVGVALFAAELFMPNQARASCGDYVRTASESRSSEHQGMPSGGPAAVPNKPPCQQPGHACSDNGSQPGKAPCRGPMCSSKGESPPLAPPSTAPQTGQDWACNWAEPCLTNSPALFVKDEVEPISPTHLANAVFRPPRSS